MTYCYDCDSSIPSHRFRCDSCAKKQTSDIRRRRSLTEWEALKLRFYKSDKAWEDNIISRKMYKDKGIVTYKDKRGKEQILPSQPREYWSKTRMVS